MTRMKGKVALVTGGGAGIGAEITKLFCAEGAAVLIVDADMDAALATVERIRSSVAAARVDAFQADVSDPEAAVAAVRHATTHLGTLDVLVNNAARRNYAKVADASLQEWQAVVSANLFGCANVSRAAIPELRRSGRSAIVNVSSCYAVTGRAGMGIYDATKAAMLALTRTLAFEETSHGIRVNAVCPGSTLTDFHIARATASGKSVDQLTTERTDTSLIGRWAHPSEIALPVLWLASDEASFITGTTLMVDGGLHIK